MSFQGFLDNLGFLSNHIYIYIYRGRLNWEPPWVKGTKELDIDLWSTLDGWMRLN
jgi:hypothetical protein